jgi:hypothetical protein
MKHGTAFTIMLTITGLFLASCSPRAEYENRLKRELASGVRYDSLFLGLYFGMPEKEFYLHCWNLNKKGLIRQGESNTTVEYEIKKELKYPGMMDFYPRFNQGKIFEMPVRFIYKGWAPWNKKLSSENLQDDVLNWYEKVYGKGFLNVDHPKRGSAYVKIDGNRRITIFREDELHVWAIFTDLLVAKNRNGLWEDTPEIDSIRLK